MAVWLRRGGMGLALLLAALVLSGCRAREVPAVRVELDGAAWDGEPVSPGEGLRVYSRFWTCPSTSPARSSSGRTA